MILTENLTKVFPTPNHDRLDHPALDGINLEINVGECISVIGQNGSGKSTLLSILSGQIQKFEGGATIFGMRVPDYVRKHSVAYASEQAHFPPHWTVNQLMKRIGRLHRLTEARYEEKTEHLIEAFELRRWLHSPLGALSKGMRQRVNLAQSLISESPLVIWDEPTSGLDWVFTDLVERQMHALIEQKKTLLFSSHDLRLARNVAKRLIHLREGQLRYTGEFISWEVFLHTYGDSTESRLLKEAS